MIKRINRKQLGLLPRGREVDGMVFCPLCWRPVAEPIAGKGSVGVYCKTCKTHVLVSFMKK